MWPGKHRTGAYVGCREILRKSFEIQALKNFGFAEWEGYGVHTSRSSMVRQAASHGAQKTQRLRGIEVGRLER